MHSQNNPFSFHSRGRHFPERVGDAFSLSLSLSCWRVRAWRSCSISTGGRISAASAQQIITRRAREILAGDSRSPFFAVFSPSAQPRVALDKSSSHVRPLESLCARADGAARTWVFFFGKDRVVHAVTRATIDGWNEEIVNFREVLFLLGVRFVEGVKGDSVSYLMNRI